MRLGERGERGGIAHGEGPLPGRRRKPRAAALIKARVSAFLERDRPAAAEGVIRLNPGFFALERMRAEAKVKARAKVAKKVVGR